MSLSNNFDFAALEIGVMANHSMPSSNWLPCDGSAFSEEDYPELYNRLVVVKENNIVQSSNSQNLVTDVDGIALTDYWSCIGEKYLNGDRIRITCNSYSSSNSNNYANVGVDIYVLNNQSLNWEKEKTIRLTTSSAAVNSTESGKYHYVQNVDISYLNGYYILLFKAVHRNNSSYTYRSNIYVGTSLSNLAHKGYFDTDQHSGWAAPYYEGGKYYFLRTWNSDNPSSSLYYATSMTATYSGSPPTYLFQYSNQNGLYPNKPVSMFYNYAVSDFGWCWMYSQSSESYSQVYVNHKYKSSNSFQYYSQGIQQYVNNQQYKMTFGERFLPITYNSTTYLLNISGFANPAGYQKKLWKSVLRTENSSSNYNDWAFVEIDNIVKPTEVIWGAKIQNDKIFLAISELVNIIYGVHNERHWMKIISVPLEDFINNNNAKVIIEKNYGYAFFEGSGKTQNNSNSYNMYQSGGFEITDQYELSGASWISSLNPYSVSFKKGVLPNVAGMYIKAK